MVHFAPTLLDIDNAFPGDASTDDTVNEKISSWIKGVYACVSSFVLPPIFLKNCSRESNRSVCVSERR